jgi:hypothetical protein
MPTARQHREPLIFTNVRHLLARPAKGQALHVQANPKVALTIDTTTFPPHVLLVRGTARVAVVDGVPSGSSL